MVLVDLNPWSFIRHIRLWMSVCVFYLEGDVRQNLLVDFLATYSQLIRYFCIRVCLHNCFNLALVMFLLWYIVLVFMLTPKKNRYPISHILHKYTTRPYYKKQIHVWIDLIFLWQYARIYNNASRWGEVCESVWSC